MAHGPMGGERIICNQKGKCHMGGCAGNNKVEGAHRTQGDPFLFYGEQLGEGERICSNRVRDPAHVLMLKCRGIRRKWKEKKGQHAHSTQRNKKHRKKKGATGDSRRGWV